MAPAAAPQLPAPQPAAESLSGKLQQLFVALSAELITPEERAAAKRKVIKSCDFAS